MKILVINSGSAFVGYNFIEGFIKVVLIDYSL